MYVPIKTDYVMLLYVNKFTISLQPVNYCCILKWVNPLVIKLA